MLKEYETEIARYETAIADLQREVDSLRGVAEEIEIGIRRSEELILSYTKDGDVK